MGHAQIPPCVRVWVRDEDADHTAIDQAIREFGAYYAHGYEGLLPNAEGEWEIRIPYDQEQEVKARLSLDHGLTFVREERNRERQG